METVHLHSANAPLLNHEVNFPKKGGESGGGTKGSTDTGNEKTRRTPPRKQIILLRLIAFQRPKTLPWGANELVSAEELLSRLKLTPHKGRGNNRIMVAASALLV